MHGCSYFLFVAGEPYKFSFIVRVFAQFQIKPAPVTVFLSQYVFILNRLQLCTYGDSTSAVCA